MQRISGVPRLMLFLHSPPFLTQDHPFDEEVLDRGAHNVRAFVGEIFYDVVGEGE